MKQFVSPRFYFGAKNRSPTSGNLRVLRLVLPGIYEQNIVGPRQIKPRKKLSS